MVRDTATETVFRVQQAEDAAARRMADYERKREARLAEEERKKAERRAGYEDSLKNNEALIVSQQLAEATTQMELEDHIKSDLLAQKNLEEDKTYREFKEKDNRVEDYLEQRFNRTKNEFEAEERALKKERAEKQAERDRKKKEKADKKAEDKRKKEEYEKRKAARLAAKQAEAAAKS